ncbi:MAG: hypothetical protein QCI38_02620 [Candidatus Thermoplasmatota archaeon]|nr:hypothetical protein [Candidatus Thermoplasmatota archaeon]
MPDKKKPRAVLLVKEDCQACAYVKEKIADLPNLEDRVSIIHGRSDDGMAILAYHERLENAPMPFLEIDGEFYEEGYTDAVDDKGKPITAAVRSKLVKKIQEICA